MVLKDAGLTSMSTPVDRLMVSAVWLRTRAFSVGTSANTPLRKLKHRVA